MTETQTNEPVKGSENNNNSKSSSGWDIESLLRKAFLRFKERALSYYIAMIVFYGVTAIGFIAFILYIAIVSGVIIGMGKSMALPAIIVSTIVGIIGFILFVYIASLAQLVLTKVIIQEPKKKIGETFHDVKPYVWGFVWLNIATSIFLFGLMPFGLITLFIVYIAWAIWGSFIVFVYLDHQKRGLDNLWMSKAIVSQKFWGIFGRIMLLYGGYYLIVFALLTYGGDLGNLFMFILGLMFAPYLMSYMYEMYKQLPASEDVKRPKVWIILSAVGYIAMISVAILATGAIISNFENIVENYAEMKNLKGNMENMQNIPLPSEYPASDVMTQ